MPSCSLNRSLATLSLPLTHSISSKTSVQIPQSPSKQSSNLVISDDSFTIAAIVEAVSLANAAAEAAKDAVSSALVLEQLEIGGGDGCRRRRRMRKRKRMMGVFSYFEDDEGLGGNVVKGSLSKSERSRYLTRRQEAEFSVSLKVGAMLEDTDSISNNTTAEAIERRGKADKACLRARECRERITLSYKRLVVSIATPYQGKGLSLQDLIQVEPMFL
ncbi:uncharacterized protein A4U43_C01F4460 [Asparagus officinalis]|uniref:Uncharacterized protein n=1 Tax=Asparagus officinalis TaxID=4686 RepID=A0A5P1FRB3_ASPOF|nr:uncharacterized protein A4U43_C01F4460 [Asparagus officinalis]